RQPQSRPAARRGVDPGLGLRRAEDSMKWLCILAFATSTALAQTYPAKPVRVIVPFPPGGTADLLARTTAQKLSASLGQQFVVESRAGAGGNLGAEFVFRAEPDGYTLLASPPHLLTVNPLLYKGTAPAMTDLLGGQVELMFDNLITAMPHVKASKLKLLGVGGEKRVAAFPDVPAIAERLPGFHSETWMAYVAPPGSPADIANKLSAGIARHVQEPDFRRLPTALQADPG